MLSYGPILDLSSMRTSRRGFVRTAGAGVMGAALAPRLARGQAPAVARGSAFDVAVVGAGVFGSWIAYHLQRAGRRVALVDAYGPGNARGSSGGQSRVIRMGYGDQEVYTRWSLRSLELWKGLLLEAGRPEQFQRAGVLWMAREQDPLTTKTLETLGRLAVRHEPLERSQLAARWPQIDLGPITWAIHEPDSFERVPSAETMARVHEFVGRRFPALKDAPIVGSEVCQYENTSNGDFLIDRHPELGNVWLVGGGSGHGFKHGPAVGEYVAARIADGKPVEAMFSLATKEKVQKRTVF